MNEALEHVLQRVAAGDLTPEQALALIDPESAAAARSPEGRAGDDLTDSPQATTSRPTGGTATAGAEPGSGTIRQIRMLLAYRSATVVSDATVAQVHVRGRHSVRQDGDVLVVDGGRNAESQQDDDRGGWFSFAALPRSLPWAPFSDDPIVIRVNPDLPLDIDATGASLRISGPEAGVRIRLLASSLKLDRVRGPLDLDVRSSSVKGSVGPSGTSQLHCEQSSVKVGLLPGTGVQIAAENRMSKVALPGVIGRSGTAIGETISARVGDGSGTLAIEALMSSVTIGADAGSR